MAKRNVPPRGLALAERLAFSTKPDGDCHIWQHAKTTKGYGTLQWDGRTQYAHRLTWEMTNGPIQKGMQICHRCDVPSCINIAHLFLGTPADNTADMVAKGRARGPKPKLPVRQIVEIFLSKERWQDICQTYGISRSTVGDIKARRLHRFITENIH